MKRIDKKVIKFFSVLADETRLQILVSLVEGPKNVNEIHKAIGKYSLSAISHQLRLLNDLDIVLYEKKGREKYFELSEDFCWCILKDALGHFDDECQCDCCDTSKKYVQKILQ